MGNDGGKAPVERAVDLFVYAPVGVALYLRDTVPTFVNLFVSRGRSEVKKRTKDVRKQATQAQSMGRFAVEVGGPKVRRKVEQGVETARKNAETVIANLASSEREVAASNDRAETERRPRPPRERVREDKSVKVAPSPPPSANGSTAIPDYDELSASQVVERLAGLRREELEAIRSYETANRGRRTILFKIDQLAN